MNGLDPETQRIFLRRYWYNHSIKELAKAMHCSENRITGILFRTRKKLRIFLEKEMATHSSVLAWRIPGTGEPDGLPSWGRTESDTTEET